MTGGRIPRQWIMRKPLVPPGWNALPEPAQDAFRHAQVTWDVIAARAAALPHGGLDRPLPAPTKPWRGIHHPLTVKFAPVTHAIALTSARRERAVLAGHPGLLDAIRAGSTAAAVGLIGAALTGASAFRDRGIATSADPGGRYVIFPPADLIEQQLSRLDRLLADDRQAPPAFHATAALALITNCHPLIDGNGRTARVMFNLLCGAQTGRGGPYLPLKEIAAFSRGGYIVRMRQAEISEDWRPLATFIAAAMGLWHTMLRDRRRGDGASSDGIETAAATSEAQSPRTMPAKAFPFQ
jgi:hypothetical protein